MTVSSVSDTGCTCWNSSSQWNLTLPLNADVESQMNWNLLLVYILCAGYLIIAAILLLNLLIAIFNHIFTKVEEKSNEIWKFQMYFLTMEFDNKTALVPPLRVQFTERHLQYLQVFETEEMANYLRRKKSEQKDSTESKVQKRVEELFNLVEEEFATDQGDALTLLTTMFANLTRENKFMGASLQPNGVHKSHDDIESVKKQEKKDAIEEAEKV
uniref:Transient receptor potential cation channel subfamily M member 1 n=1 Tax=Magallana gigas TaxID=29159 RepID=K1QHQ9_MAGGI